MADELSKEIGGEIPAEKAKEWIQKYQDQNPKGMKSCFFGSDILEKILNQEKCVGLRIYNAIAEDGSPAFVLVGAKESGSNIWPSNAADSTPDGIVGEYGGYCPPMCLDNE